jgi:hypothetical protein
MPLVHVAAEIDSVVGDRVFDFIAEEVDSPFGGVAGFHSWPAFYLTGNP